jgi:hypothetical protein
MRTLLSCIAFVLSGILYAWLGLMFLYPIYFGGWEWAWDRLGEISALSWAAVAGIAVMATALLVIGLSLLNGQHRHPPA